MYYGRSAPPPTVWVPVFPLFSMLLFSPPYNLVDRTEEKTQLRAEGCHNNFVMACDTYLKQALPRPPSPSRPGIRRHDGAQNKKIPGCSGDDPERGT